MKHDAALRVAGNRGRARALSTGSLSWLLAVSGGLAVASVYYAQPLLDVMAAESGLGTAKAGLIGAAAQAGYLVGLLVLVPLGDLLNRRNLLVCQMALSALALCSVAFARDLDQCGTRFLAGEQAANREMPMTYHGQNRSVNCVLIG